VIYHIIAPIPRLPGQGNKFYSPTDARVTKTLCGQARTSNDMRFGWVPYSIGEFEPCPECLRIRSIALSQPRVISSEITPDTDRRPQ
jgi:hypothetical protein